MHANDDCDKDMKQQISIYMTQLPWALIANAWFSRFFSLEQPPSTGLTLNLASNNPFRNRAVSPSLASPGLAPISPVSPFDDPTPTQRPLSRNPFLDPALVNTNSKPASQNLISLDDMSAEKKPSSPTAEELFVGFHPARPSCPPRSWCRVLS